MAGVKLVPRSGHVLIPARVLSNSGWRQSSGSAAESCSRISYRGTAGKLEMLIFRVK